MSDLHKELSKYKQGHQLSVGKLLNKGNLNQ